MRLETLGTFQVIDHYSIWEVVEEMLVQRMPLKWFQVVDSSGAKVVVEDMRVMSVSALSSENLKGEWHRFPLFSVVTVTAETMEDYMVAQPLLKKRFEESKKRMKSSSPFGLSNEWVILYIPLGSQMMASSTSDVYDKVMERVKEDFASDYIHCCSVQLFDLSAAVVDKGMQEKAKLSDALKWDGFLKLIQQILARAFRNRSLAYEEELGQRVDGGFNRFEYFSSFFILKSSYAQFSLQFHLYHQAIRFFEELNAIQSTFFSSFGDKSVCSAELVPMERMASSILERIRGNSASQFDFELYTFIHLISAYKEINDFHNLMDKTKSFFSYASEYLSKKSVTIAPIDSLVWKLNSMWWVNGAVSTAALDSQSLRVFGIILTEIAFELWDFGEKQGYLSENSSKRRESIDGGFDSCCINADNFAGSFRLISSRAIDCFRKSHFERFVQLLDWKMAMLDFSHGFYQQAFDTASSWFMRMEEQRQWPSIAKRFKRLSALCLLKMDRLQEFVQASLQIFKDGDEELLDTFLSACQSSKMPFVHPISDLGGYVNVKVPKVNIVEGLCFELVVEIVCSVAFRCDQVEITFDSGQVFECDESLISCRDGIKIKCNLAAGSHTIRNCKVSIGALSLVTELDQIVHVMGRQEMIGISQSDICPSLVVGKEGVFIIQIDHLDSRSEKVKAAFSFTNGIELSEEKEFKCRVNGTEKSCISNGSICSLPELEKPSEVVLWIPCRVSSSETRSSHEICIALSFECGGERISIEKRLAVDVQLPITLAETSCHSIGGKRFVTIFSDPTEFEFFILDAFLEIDGKRIESEVWKGCLLPQSQLSCVFEVKHSKWSLQRKNCNFYIIGRHSSKGKTATLSFPLQFMQDSSPEVFDGNVICHIAPFGFVGAFMAVEFILSIEQKEETEFKLLFDESHWMLLGKERGSLEITEKSISFNLLPLSCGILKVPSLCISNGLNSLRIFHEYGASNGTVQIYPNGNLVLSLRESN